MDSTKDDYTGIPDLPQNTPRKSPERDRKRSAMLILGAVAAAVALVGVLA